MGTPNNNGSTEKTGSAAFPSFKMPNIDMNAIMEYYKKNLEVLGLINKMSIEVCNGITKLQSAFVKQMMTDIGSIWEKAGKPSDMMTKFSEVTRDTVEKAIGNNKKISEMIVSTNKELSAAITKRVKDSVEEAKNIVNKK